MSKPPLQLPEQAPDEHPPSNLDRREVAAWYHGHGCGWQAARAVLSRWGRPAPVPAGERQAAPVPVAPYREVADLVVWLEDHSAECLELDRPEWSKFIAKAAKFLHLYLKAAPVPVAVSERLPGAEDCDAQGMFWWGRGGKWVLLNMRAAQMLGYTHWLPAQALPLPSGEVEHD